MSLKVNTNQIKKALFFLMMWVFYSLNSRYFKVPMATTIRWLILGVLILFVMFTHQARINKPPIVIAFYLVAVIPSVFMSVNVTESVIKILSFIVVVWGSYIYFASLKDISDLVSVMKIIMVIMILFEIQSIICIFLGIGYVGDRATGITTNANTLGIYSNLSLLASFYWSEHSRGIKNHLSMMLMLFSVGTAIASGSRTAFITLLLNLSIILFLKMRGICRIILLFALGGFGYLLLNGHLLSLNIRALDSLFSEGGLTRGALWDKGIEVWKDHQLFGCGYAVSQVYNDLPGLEGYAFHNSYLTYLAETGIWGIGIIGMVFFSQLKHIFVDFVRTIQSGEITLSYIGNMMLLELMIAAWSESFLFAVGSTEGCTFWVIFAWSLVYRERLKTE